MNVVYLMGIHSTRFYFVCSKSLHFCEVGKIYFITFFSGGLVDPFLCLAIVFKHYLVVQMYMYNVYFVYSYWSKNFEFSFLFLFTFIHCQIHSKIHELLYLAVSYKQMLNLWWLVWVEGGKHKMYMLLYFALNVDSKFVPAIQNYCPLFSQ